MECELHLLIGRKEVNMIITKTMRFFKTGMIVFQAIAVGAALWEAYKKSQAENKFKEADLSKKFRKGHDIIDEQSWESFPASDAPASNRFT